MAMHASIKYVYTICLLRPKHVLCSNFHKVKVVDNTMKRNYLAQRYEMKLAPKRL